MYYMQARFLLSKIITFLYKMEVNKTHLLLLLAFLASSENIWVVCSISSRASCDNRCTETDRSIHPTNSLIYSCVAIRIMVMGLQIQMYCNQHEIVYCCHSFSRMVQQAQNNKNILYMYHTFIQQAQSLIHRLDGQTLNYCPVLPLLP